MANVRCPMCSKLNPPEAEVCAYCGARLKPVNLGSSQPSPKQPAGQSEDEPDWLRDLRADAPLPRADSSLREKPTEPAEPEADVPDWLSRIRNRPQDETSSPADFSGEDKNDEPDWMKTLHADEPSDQGPDADWLSRLQSDTATPANPPQPPAATPAPSERAQPETPDWLQSFSAETSTSPFASGSQPSGADKGKTPESSPDEDDWMKSLSSWQPAAQETQPDTNPTPTPTGQDDLDWFNQLDSTPEKTTPEEDNQAGRPGLPDFFADLEKDEPSSANEPTAAAPFEQGGVLWSPPEETPEQDRPSSGFGLTGFLSRFNDKDAAAQPPQEPQTPRALDFGEDSSPSPESGSAFTSDQDLPDWLSGGKPASTAPEASQEANLPSWLAGFETQSPAQPVAESPAEDPNVPDWLNKASPAQPESSQSADADLPDWLSGFYETPSAGQVQESQPFGQPESFAESSADSNLPDWLSGEPNPLSNAAKEVPSAKESPISETDGQPDWFASLQSPGIETTQPGQTPDEQPSEPEPAVSTGPFAQVYSSPAKSQGETPDLAGGEDVPDWLRSFQEDVPPETGETAPSLVGDESAVPAANMEADQPFVVDLPDWLAEDEAVKPGEISAQNPSDAGGEVIAQAELPEWVKEMRPMESIISGEGPVGEADQRVEKAGPLAGMRGVLPAEESAARYRKPPVYSMKLRVSEKQRTQAALFDNILAQESQPLQLPAARSHATGLLLRALIALILVAALALPMIPGMKMAPLWTPVLMPSDMENMFNRLDQGLIPGAPVLLAVDYEPGLSGEMHLASSALVDQLMAKDARIVIVSTVPTGPALAEQLLVNAQQAHPQYDLAKQTLNLGYLPGGTTSLLEFAQQPQTAALGWQSSYLGNLSGGLQAFSQIVLITDRAETGRAWVEQVQPVIGKVPLFIVASAQAAPLLEPYVGSGQVTGMVRGLLGGALYAQKSGQVNSPTMNYLTAYQIGIILAFILVLGGGLVSGGMSLMKRNNKDEE